MKNKVCVDLLEWWWEIVWYVLGYYENLQDKLNQIKDAREALNALREEHIENKKRQAFERERQRQIQLALKLGDMRQKKQVNLFAIEIKKQSISIY
jgi:hypothetical protein